jgi:hypothetical protein
MKTYNIHWAYGSATFKAASYKAAKKVAAYAAWHYQLSMGLRKDGAEKMLIVRCPESQPPVPINE